MNDDERKKADEELKKLGENLAKAADEVKKAAEKSEKEIKQLGDLTAETKKSADEALTKHNTILEEQKKLIARLDEIEQKQVRRGEVEPNLKSLGDIIISSDNFKKLINSSFRGQTSFKINVKDITSAVGTVGSGVSASTSLVQGMRVPDIIRLLGDRRLTVRDLVAPGETSSNSVEYARENVFTNLAAVVSEGAAKPKSDISFELETAPVRTIAHYFKASRQIMDDAPGLRSYVDARGRYGLKLAEENELLNGDGTGQHIHGLIPQATAYAASFTPANPQVIDTIRLALLQVMLAEFPPTGIVMSPIDWARVQLTKDTQGRYIIGNPADSNTPRLWNLPVVETQAMTVDKFLVGAFNLAAQIFDRMDVEVLISTENEDDFIKNMITIRIEERLALAVYRPAALVYGDFGNVT